MRNTAPLSVGRWWAAIALLAFAAGGFCDFALHAMIAWHSASEKLAKTEEVLQLHEKPRIFEVTKAEIANAHRKGMMFLDSEGNVLLIKRDEK